MNMHTKTKGYKLHMLTRPNLIEKKKLMNPHYYINS